MANVDQPNGFTLLAQETYEMEQFSVDAANATILGHGDAVIQEADGNVARAATDSGDLVIGVITSIKNSTGSPITTLAATTAGTVEVALATPGKPFGVQSDGDGATVAQTDVGATANITIGNASTFTGRSIMELDTSNIGTGNSMRILGLVREVGIAFGTANANLRIMFVESQSLNNTSV